MTQSQIGRDLSRDLQHRLGEVIEQRIGIMRHALSTGEIAIVLIEVAVSTVLTTSATVAASLQDEDPGTSFDRTIAAIAAMAQADRERSLAAIAAGRTSKEAAR